MTILKSIHFGQTMIFKIDITRFSSLRIVNLGYYNKFNVKNMIYTNFKYTHIH